MSAIITFQQTDRVTMLSDGAVYTFTGELTGACPKVFPLPHLNAAIAVRGSQASLALVAGTLTTKADRYDDIEGALPEILQLLQVDEERRTGDTVEIWVAGFSESRGPDSYVMVNHIHAPGLPPFVAARAGSLGIAPATPEIGELARSLVPTSDVNDIDPIAVGLEIMKTQRGMKHQIMGRAMGETLNIVGTFVQAVEIDRDEIRTRIVHRWADRRGEKIQPN